MKQCKICSNSGIGLKFHGLVCYPCRAKTRSEDATKAARRAAEWQRKNPERRREIALSYYYKLRDLAFDAYGWKCQCCGITEPMFLSIDHVNGGGNEHRRELKHQGSGAAFYKWLRDSKYPDMFQTLCMNCNHGRMRNGGICPHQTFKA